MTLLLVEASASGRHTTVGMFEIRLLRLWGTHLRGRGLGALSRARVQQRHGRDRGCGSRALYGCCCCEAGSLPGGMWSWMVLIFPCSGKRSFTPHFLNSSADPNRA